MKKASSTGAQQDRQRIRDRDFCRYAARLAGSLGDTVRVTPWHSDRDTHHHDNSDCEAARKISERERKPGTGDKPLCNECAKLDSAGP